mmetsp:Transcript_10777/g.16050  ORF Transcript_10777/g.16050 Transcript_10777/m.16050 type:complete len:150 (-) Transcript_10777:1111-1560(-)
MIFEIVADTVAKPQGTHANERSVSSPHSPPEPTDLKIVEYTGDAIAVAAITTEAIAASVTPSSCLGTCLEISARSDGTAIIPTTRKRHPKMKNPTERGEKQRIANPMFITMRDLLATARAPYAAIKRDEAAVKNKATMPIKISITIANV